MVQSKIERAGVGLIVIRYPFLFLLVGRRGNLWWVSGTKQEEEMLRCRSLV